MPLKQQQRSLDKVQAYLNAPVEENGLVNDNTKAHRQWLMRIWNQLRDAYPRIPVEWR
jgi:hypothetical protein